MINLGAHICRPYIFAHRVNAVFEESPEPSSKKHHFGHDEEDKAIAQTNTNDWRVIANVAFGYDVGPPAEHDIKHADKSHQE